MQFRWRLVHDISTHHEDWYRWKLNNKIFAFGHKIVFRRRERRNYILTAFEWHTMRETAPIFVVRLPPIPAPLRARVIFPAGLGRILEIRSISNETVWKSIREKISDKRSISWKRLTRIAVFNWSGFNPSTPSKCLYTVFYINLRHQCISI